VRPSEQRDFGSTMPQSDQARRTASCDPGFHGRLRQFTGRFLPFAGGIGLFIVLCRNYHQSLPDDRAASFHAVAGGVLGPYPGIPPGGNAGAAAGHPDVHLLVLLGLSRQGAGRHRVSLKPKQQTAKAGASGKGRVLRKKPSARQLRANDHFAPIAAAPRSPFDLARASHRLTSNIKANPDPRDETFSNNVPQRRTGSS
jgi:hypothetical protein